MNKSCSNQTLQEREMNKTGRLTKAFTQSSLLSIFFCAHHFTVIISHTHPSLQNMIICYETWLPYVVHVIPVCIADTTCVSSCGKTSYRADFPVPSSPWPCWVPTPCSRSWVSTTLRCTVMNTLRRWKWPRVRPRSWRTKWWSCIKHTGQNTVQMHYQNKSNNTKIKYILNQMSS